MSTLLLASTAARVERVRQARTDFAVFVEGLHQDEGLRVAAFQRAWHRLLDAHDRLVLWAPIEHGKTVQLVVARSVWEMGRNHSLQMLIIGAMSGAAEKRLSAIRRIIDESPWVREVFPSLVPLTGKYAKWTDDKLRIAGGALTAVDYTAQAIGFGGSVLGARQDLIIADDIVTFETTATALQREKVIQWWRSTIEGRLKKHGRALVIGNAWFPDDLMHWLVTTAKYTGHKDEAYRERLDGSIDPPSVLWPEQWTAERLGILAERLGGDIEARRQLRCIAYASGSAQFDVEWFDRAFTLGEREWAPAFGKLLPRFLPTYDGHWPVKTGVDLGVSRKEGADSTAIFTIAVDPVTQRRFPIHVERGKWKGPEIIAKLQRVHALYGGDIVVENNGAQEYLLEFMRDQGVPVQPTTTGSNKSDPRFGVPSIAQELEQGMWALPLEPAIHQWRADCLAYSPGKHAGDTLMASWFAREAARKSGCASGATVNPASDRATATLRARYDMGARGSRAHRSYVLH